jgi:hypothetical protein
MRLDKRPVPLMRVMRRIRSMLLGATHSPRASCPGACPGTDLHRATAAL